MLHPTVKTRNYPWCSLCFQDVCKIVVNYCHTLKERVRVLSENSDPGSAINMVSTDPEGIYCTKY